MSTFRVYLPPDLQLGNSRTISFRSIPRPQSYTSLLDQSHSQSGPLDIQESLLRRIKYAEQVKVDRKGKGKRPAAEDEHEDEVEIEPERQMRRTDGGRNINHDHPIEEMEKGNRSEDHSQGSSRRRSRRVNNTSNLMVHLPVLQEDDSIISLNTTISHPPSQPPSGETSMYNLPTWTVPLSRLTALSSLLSPSPFHSHFPNHTEMAIPKDGGYFMEGKRVDLIVCVTGTSRPILRKTKLERAKGQDGNLWIAKWDVIAPKNEHRGVGKEGAAIMGEGAGAEGVGGEVGEVGCSVVLWDKCAKDYCDNIRRGDVVLIEHADFRPSSKKDKAQISLSPSFPNPKVTILYRTLPRYETTSNYVRPSSRLKDSSGKGKIVQEDQALRPDLRVGRSDPAVRRVAEIARWFATWVDGEPP